MKLKKLGIVALALGIGITVTTSSFAAEKTEDEKVNVDEIFSIERYIEYVKSLGVLTEDEMQKFADSERQKDKLFDEIQEIEEKGNLTEEQKQEIENKNKEIDKIIQETEILNNKITDLTVGEDEISEEDEEKLLQQHLEEIKSLGILTESEMQQYEKVEREAYELYKSTKPFYEKDSLTKEEEKEMEKIYNKTEKLYESIYDIMLKIEKSEY